ncbi:MAG: sensor domain-containing diguanylate cyclase [Deltaproteobacteria bacterium]|nr:MAG: sensor domain-containing diguanylate cyclase [Deltaproteobacteria bacterium]
MRTMRVYAIEPDKLPRFFDRVRHPSSIYEAPRIDLVFSEILRVADQFVPSEAGSILLDDPEIKFEKGEQSPENELVFIACFGEKAAGLPGTRIRADRGIIGQVYRSGRAYISEDVRRDKHFFRKLDEQTKYDTHAVICVPIKIANSICGVLELINRIGRVRFTKQELALLEIFARYISTSMQNILDANRQRELARRDDLTDLYNDRYFFYRLDEEMRQAQETQSDLSLIFLDLDNFKQVNDRYGHLSGSRLLREMGGLLRGIVTDRKCTIARYGGDEFVVIAPGYGPEEVFALAERIRAGVERHTFLDADLGPDEPRLAISGVITTSIGVASLSVERLSGLPPSHRKNEFVRLADMAMYRAKEGGKNRVCKGE